MISDEFFEVLDELITELTDDDMNLNCPMTASSTSNFLKEALPNIEDSDLMSYTIREQICSLLDLFVNRQRTEKDSKIVHLIQSVFGNKKQVQGLLTRSKGLKQKLSQRLKQEQSKPVKKPDFKVPAAFKNTSRNADLPTLSETRQKQDSSVSMSAGYVGKYSRKYAFPPHIDQMATSWSVVVHKRLQEPKPVIIEKDSMGFNMSVSSTRKNYPRNGVGTGVCATETQDFIDSILSQTPLYQLEEALKKEVVQHDGTVRGKIAKVALGTYIEAIRNKVISFERVPA